MFTTEGRKLWPRDCAAIRGFHNWRAAGLSGSIDGECREEVSYSSIFTMKKKTKGRILDSVTPSAEDVARAGELPLTACPRRYCWWWKSLTFDWETRVADECEWLAATKPLHWEFPNVPCCRAVPETEIDHYEPREPHLEADGFHRYRFCGSRNNLPDKEQET